MNRRTVPQGFTLVEIAIVLVIIGLLIGGVLKGQELINNAKVRAIADHQNSLKVAWLSFVDRFAALPGDYVEAHIYIANAAAGDGDGVLLANESPLVFQHLASAGFVRCPQCTETNATVGPTANNSLINEYGGIMSIWHDAEYHAVRSAIGANTAALMIHTGPRIPSNILAEVDRKIDDGIPNAGALNFNEYDPRAVDGKLAGGTAAANCMKQDEVGSIDGTVFTTDAQYWRSAGSSPTVWPDCGGALIIHCGCSHAKR